MCEINRSYEETVPQEVFQTFDDKYCLSVVNDTSHCSKVLTWFHDLSVTRYLEVRFHQQTLRDIEEFFKSHFTRNSVLIGIFYDSELIGYYSLKWSPIHKVGEIGVVIGEKRHWGKGVVKITRPTIVRAMFSFFNLYKIQGRVYASNRSSVRGYEDEGWNREAVLQEQFIFKGRRVDEIIFSIKKDSFFGVTKND
ncbi:GNAT family N-acetyltransferase [Thalassobaculum litoreum]|uniref:GNAT family N-acetyltransferase n=1 Tax=Thalassobaculum litoreum TaxID=420996 RepID=UPI000B80C1DD|nr:GNAT family protein [Thalassobaculum litoreum]